MALVVPSKCGNCFGNDRYLIPANPAVGQELLAILSLLPYEFVRQPQLHPTEGNALFFQLLIFLERLLSTVVKVLHSWTSKKLHDRVDVSSLPSACHLPA
ncbi:hypothetical protein L1987_77968 [Smallanthus sonchifolius]|uniref:Uncharacterized protein n=2 Tax=Smallanthus sonchifolius TaxID=185202 RepID=A0ACB8ZAI6_9ASTR|nr:hypothetical protein L1987_77965 [Smallanthus sonchifolius]KAI3694981.1 hypothetical protein L1987_77968 [Smallanthus sonchifolius]